VSRSTRRRAGIGAIVFGTGYFTGQAGELVFGSPSTLVDVVFVLLGARSGSADCSSPSGISGRLPPTRRRAWGSGC
jgi:hypothetical protein